MTRLGLVAAFLAAVAVPIVDGAGVTSRLQFLLPKELRRDDGYDHREALFGLPPYGGSIQQNVYYADSTLCETTVDYSRGGYPTRPNDATGKMAPWKPPFILMVDRGDCTFVQKARNAQKAGATGVLIADNTCLCLHSDCFSDGDTKCESKEPTMADDGSGSDVTVPSFLLFKQDADPIKEVLKQNTVVRASMSWELPAPDASVEYDFWSTPVDEMSLPLKQSFREVAIALGDHATFTPHMYVYDGILAGCRGPNGEDECFNLCTNSGRYCSADPDEDMDVGLSGADVVKESLRQLCVWQEYGKDGIGAPWWDYIEEFIFRCSKASYFTNEDCIEDAMNRASIDKSVVDACMTRSGGLDGDIENEVLERELEAREEAGIVILPTFIVNQAPLRGAMTSEEVFGAICAGYKTGSEPDVCKSCDGCSELKECVTIGRCKGSSSLQDTAVSLPVFAGSIAGVVLCFGLVGLIQWHRQQRQMRAQVRGILAEYMPLDVNTKVESVGFTETSDDDAVALS